MKRNVGGEERDSISMSQAHKRDDAHSRRKKYNYIPRRFKR
jgi:hypothetical protein